MSRISTRNGGRRKHNMRGVIGSMLLTTILFAVRFHGLRDSSHLQFSGKPCDLHLWFELPTWTECIGLSQVTLGCFQGGSFMLLLCWIKNCMNTARARTEISVGLSEAPCKAQLISSRHSALTLSLELKPGALEKQSQSPSCFTFFSIQEQAGYRLKIKALFSSPEPGQFLRTVEEGYVCYRIFIQFFCASCWMGPKEKSYRAYTYK